MTIFSFQKSKFLNLLAVFVVSILLASVPRSSANASTITEHTQQMLNELGYDSGVVDGMDGPATQAAFEQFVKDNQNLRNAIATGKLELPRGKKVGTANVVGFIPDVAKEYNKSHLENLSKMSPRAKEYASLIFKFRDDLLSI